MAEKRMTRPIWSNTVLLVVVGVAVAATTTAFLVGFDAGYQLRDRQIPHEYESDRTYLEWLANRDREDWITANFPRFVALHHNQELADTLVTYPDLLRSTGLDVLGELYDQGYRGEYYIFED